MMFSLKPIGYLSSPFTFKNGTPRQPSVCQQARGVITIDKDVFNNPEHSLEGLEEYSHVWLFFIFHKNNNAHTKAKVKPPRLDGKKTGVFSTRSPYRPNNIGLTLAKIESIHGASLIVSGIDILDGTPIIDLKPYIPQYDCPIQHPGTSSDRMDASQHVETNNGRNAGSEPLETNLVQKDDTSIQLNVTSSNENNVAVTEFEEGTLDIDDELQYGEQNKEHLSDKCTGVGCKNVTIDSVNNLDGHQLPNSDSCLTKLSANLDMSCNPDVVYSDLHCDQVGHKRLGPLINCDTHSNSDQAGKKVSSSENPVTSNLSSENGLQTATWVNQAPVHHLNVRFTPSAESQLRLFSREGENGDFTLHHLKSTNEARDAIMNILHEDPRSTYRRKSCVDNLYYFTLDILHVTCWFDIDTNSVEVVRIKPVSFVEKLKHK